MKKQGRFKRRIRRQPRNKFYLISKINIYKVFSIMLIVLFMFSMPTVVKKLIKIDKIECNSQFGSCNEAIINSLQVTGNYKDAKKVLEQRLKTDIRINSYLIQYKIPSTIKIDLSLKKPRYVIKDLSNKYYLIDKDGLILEISDHSDQKYLINNVSYFIGQKISDKDKFALKIVEKVAMINSIQSSKLENNELKIVTQENKLLRFPLEGEVDVLVGSLRLIFSRLNDETVGTKMEDVHEIDFRFKNVVLR